MFFTSLRELIGFLEENLPRHAFQNDLLDMALHPLMEGDDRQTIFLGDGDFEEVIFSFLVAKSLPFIFVIKGLRGAVFRPAKTQNSREIDMLFLLLGQNDHALLALE